MQYPTFFSKMLTCDSDATCTIYLKPAYNFKIYGSKDTLPIPVNFTISTKPIDKSITIEKYANLLFDGYRKNPRVSLYTATVHNTPKNATYSLVYEIKSNFSGLGELVKSNKTKTIAEEGIIFDHKLYTIRYESASDIYPFYFPLYDKLKKSFHAGIV